jgi:hypothetical protein
MPPVQPIKNWTLRNGFSFWFRPSLGCSRGGPAPSKADAVGLRESAGPAVAHPEDAFRRGFRHGFHEGYRVGFHDRASGRRPHPRVHGSDDGGASERGSRPVFESGITAGASAGKRGRCSRPVNGRRCPLYRLKPPRHEPGLATPARMPNPTTFPVPQRKFGGTSSLLVIGVFDGPRLPIGESSAAAAPGRYAFGFGPILRLDR